MHVFIGGICESKLVSNESDIHAYVNFPLVGSHAIYSFVFVNNKRKSKIMVMNNKGTNAYTIRNFRRVQKNAYVRIACVYFASALFAYLRAALYMVFWCFISPFRCLVRSSKTTPVTQSCLYGDW